MRLEYRTYEEAKKNFKWSERWEVFDHGQKSLNIAYECIDRHPKERIAIRIKRYDGGCESYTFGELQKLTCKFAYMLGKRGISNGDRVAIMLNPSLEYYVSFYGTLRRGAVAVPCYALLGPEGIEYRLKESNAKMIILPKEKMKDLSPGIVTHIIASEELRELIMKEKEDYYEPKTSAETLALIQFSSGTTGLPKPVYYNHSAISIAAIYTKFWLDLQRDDLYMCTSSPAWGHGIWYGTVAPLIFGNGIGAYSGKFDPEVFLEALEEFEISVISAIPRVYRMIMECGKLDSRKLKLRRLTYTGSQMEIDVSQYFLDRLGLYIASTYGNTEVGPIVLDYAFEDYVPRLGSAGKPMIGVKIGILDDDGKELPPGKVGEVAVWRKGRWNPIGDSGYFDEDGYFWPIGRSDDVIKSSGFRIGPFEIENVLEKHPAVQKAAVVGTPDPERGEIVKAFIILKSNIQTSNSIISDIQTFVKNRLSMHEYPKEIEFVQELPETPDGKIRRKELKRREYERKRRIFSA